MEFIISELKTEEDFKGKVLKDLQKILSDIEGYCSLDHPFVEDEFTPDFPVLIITSPFWGYIILEAYPFLIQDIKYIASDKWTIEERFLNEIDITNRLEDKKFVIYSLIIKNRKLRNADDRFNGKWIVYLPYVNKKEWIKKFGDEFACHLIFKDTITDYFNALKKEYMEPLFPELWNEFIKILTGHIVILKKPPRRIRKEKTKAWIVSKVEEQVQSIEIDEEQIKIGQQIPPGPQRIRGLAGTGKTIILTMKAAFMHYKHPEWDIIYTFNTQSLYNFIHSLIERFYNYFSGGGKPDWEKLQVLHGWGGKEKEGLYSFVAKLSGISPKTFTEAKNFYDHKHNIELLGKVCIDLIKNGDISQLFDAILIDEAQDFHKGFFQLAYRILKEPKRLIWVYDELQSLEDISIPTAKDIFGEKEDRTPLVDLDGFYPGRIEKDFVLYKTYRNPRIILMLAHFFGMGIFRNKGAIQFIPKPEAWEDLGYRIGDGKFEVDKGVIITRPKKNSPNIIEDLVDPRELIIIRCFNNKKGELDWIAEQICRDIFEDQLLPNDILVIGLDDRNLFKYFGYLKRLLKEKGINSFIVGKDYDRSTFYLPNYITLSTVFKAKGNEANKVYIFNFENAEIEEKIIQARNMAFTCITRTKGWVVISGTGNKMKDLEREINIIIKNYPNISFKVPDISKIKRYLDNIEYEKRRLRIKKSEEYLKKSLELIKQLEGESELSPETLKKMEEILEKAKKNNR